MNREQFKNLKIGSIIESIKEELRFAVVLKNEQNLCIYDYLKGSFRFVQHEIILKEFRAINIKDVMSMEANVHSNLMAITKFMNGALKLYQCNPLFYKEVMEYTKSDTNFAYISTKDIDEDVIIVDMRTNKNYTIVDVLHIDDSVYFTLFRNGMVLGEVMEYERLCISQKEFEDHFKYAKEIEYNAKDEYIYTEEDIKAIFNQPEPVTKPESKPTVKEIVEIKQNNLSLNEIRYEQKTTVVTLSVLDKLIADKEYLDVFTGGLKKGDKLWLKYINDEDCLFFNVSEIKSNSIYGSIELETRDGKSSIIQKRYEFTDLELYLALYSKYNFDWHCEHEESERIMTLIDNDELQTIIKDSRVYDISNNSISYVNTKDNACYTREGNVKEMFVGYKSHYINRYLPVRKHDVYEHMEQYNVTFGTTLIYKNKLPLVVYKENKKSISCYVNLFNDGELKSVRIPKELFNSDFLISADLSLFNI